MDNNINLVIEDFKNSIVENINNCGLPPAMVFYVMKDVYRDVEDGYKRYLDQAKEAEKQVPESNDTSTTTSEEEEYLVQD